MLVMGNVVNKEEDFDQVECDSFKPIFTLTTANRTPLCPCCAYISIGLHVLEDVFPFETFYYC